MKKNRWNQPIPRPQLVRADGAPIERAPPPPQTLEAQAAAMPTEQQLRASILDDDLGKSCADILGKYLTTYVETILPRIQAEHGRLPEEYLARLNDKCSLSILAGWITHAVHPLARNVFMTHLTENVKIMGDAEWSKITPRPS